MPLRSMPVGQPSYVQCTIKEHCVACLCWEPSTARGPYLDLVKVPLGLPRCLDGCGERGVIAQHQQPPLGPIIGLYNLGAHKLQQRELTSSKIQSPQHRWQVTYAHFRCKASPPKQSSTCEQQCYAAVWEPHLWRDVLCAQLCFHMRVIELADEGVCPSLARVYGDMHVVLSMPFSSFLCAHSPHHQRDCFLG